MIPLSDGYETGEELHDDRSESMNAKSVIHLGIGCITDEVLTQVEIKKYISISHIPLTKHFPNNLDKQAFHELTLQISGTNGEMYKR